MYIVQLYKEDWGILRMLGCRAVALPSTEQIVLIIPLRCLSVSCKVKFVCRVVFPVLMSFAASATPGNFVFKDTLTIL